MIGGAADLVESTKTELEGGGVFSAGHAGRNIAFGIREHAMGSIVNGIALDPAMLKPFGSTFLIFSDYMRPAVRLSALMGLETAVGVDARLGRRSARTGRRTSRSSTTWRCGRSRTSGTLRPADANETSVAWRIAMERKDGPVALALTRQKLPTLDRREVASVEGVLRGAYTLWQSGDGEPEVIVIATGSRGTRRARGSASSWTRTCGSSRCRAGSSSTSRRRSTATRCCRRRSRRASRSRPGSRSAGSGGSAHAAHRVGVDRFGASAPYQRILEEFGITADAVAAAAAGVLERVA